MKKSQKGFTLVELVVVIAIIGVLAAILVPSMLNYVKKSRLKTANSNAKTAYNAVAEIMADAETNGFAKSAVLTTATASDYKIGNDTVYEAASAASITDSGAKKVAQVLAENGDEAGCFKVLSTTINSQDSYVVFWAKTTSDNMVGEYPDAIEWDTWNGLTTKPTLSTATYKYSGLT